MLRCRSLLDRVPRVGSPASSLLCGTTTSRRLDWLGSPPCFLVPGFPGGRRDLPTFLGNPSTRASGHGPRQRRLVRTPGQSPCVSTHRFRRPSVRTGRPLQQCPISGLTPAARISCCLRFVPLLALGTQDSLSGGGPQPYRGGTFTRGSLRKVSARYIASSSPRLRGATDSRLQSEREPTCTAQRVFCVRLVSGWSLKPGAWSLACSARSRFMSPIPCRSFRGRSRCHR